MENIKRIENYNNIIKNALYFYYSNELLTNDNEESTLNTILFLAQFMTDKKNSKKLKFDYYNETRKFMLLSYKSGKDFINNNFIVNSNSKNDQEKLTIIIPVNKCPIMYEKNTYIIPPGIRFKIKENELVFEKWDLDFVTLIFRALYLYHKKLSPVNIETYLPEQVLSLLYKKNVEIKKKYLYFAIPKEYEIDPEKKFLYSDDLEEEDDTYSKYTQDEKDIFSSELQEVEGYEYDMYDYDPTLYLDFYLNKIDINV
jgi:hypothetical protein